MVHRYYLLLFLSLLAFSGCVSTDNAADDGKSGYEIPNPAAVYCAKMGYNYTIVNSERGQYGVCTFSDGSSCDAWDFFNGKCGVEFSYCEKSGGKLVVGKEGCPFSPECSFCILPDGSKKLEWKYFKENVLEEK